MKIAVINETSAADRNADIMEALHGRGHEIINAGMTETGGSPELTYIHTGLLTGLLLQLGKVDLVIGGCGTGQGFMNSAIQYPGIFCGLIQNPLDGWLFGQINGGNCISLALNYGYGWAGNENLRFIFDRIFSLDEWGMGFPSHRRESQQQSRKTLACVSAAAHHTFTGIILAIDDTVLMPVLKYPGVAELLDVDSIENVQLKSALLERLK